MLGLEKHVSISLIIPLFAKLKEVLAEKVGDCDMIKNIKLHMLQKNAN